MPSWRISSSEISEKKQRHPGEGRDLRKSCAIPTEHSAYLHEVPAFAGMTVPAFCTVYDLGDPGLRRDDVCAVDVLHRHISKHAASTMPARLIKQVKLCLLAETGTGLET